MLLEFLRDEMINGILIGRVAHGFQVGPVTFILRSLLDPFANEIAVGIRELLDRFWWRHDLIGIMCRDVLEEFALVRIAGLDDAGRTLCGIESQFGVVAKCLLCAERHTHI